MPQVSSIPNNGYVQLAAPCGVSESDSCYQRLTSPPFPVDHNGHTPPFYSWMIVSNICEVNTVVATSSSTQSLNLTITTQLN